MKDKVELKNLGSLITYDDDWGHETCLGYLIVFPGHGVYDANLGRVEVSEEHVKIHNRLLDDALIKGLDNCQVGQAGYFYLSGSRERPTVISFCGVLVSDDVTVTKKGIEFRRDGKKFRGPNLREGTTMFNFKRVQ